MDAAYLKKNVVGPLTEAMTAMAVKIPEDEIEFLGKYLLTYVERKKMESDSKTTSASIEEKLAKYEEEEAIKSRAADEVKLEQASFQAKYKRFVESLQFEFKNKQDAMDAVTNFIETTLNIPAAYIAVRKVAGETETLHYLSAGPSQKEVVVGKKLTKASVEEGDEAPPRQGLSFDAFKLPEFVEEEEPAELEEGETPVVKVPPKMQPLIVENTMREKRCKFFGIPRLGSYAAIPVTYQSLDHEEGCVMGTVEEGSEVPADYTFNPKESLLIIGMDTVGKFRAFSVSIQCQACFAVHSEV
jgi:hypothetical protein